jgi:hypothetical protein
MVSEVDALEDVGTFGHITKEVEKAISRAVTAFGGYSEAQFDGDIRGAASEVHADVRALTNVALGLSPPSRDFYDKVLGGLVEVEHDGSPPRDAGPVPYPPLRVSVEEIEKHGQLGRGENGLEAAIRRDAFSGSTLTPEVLKILVRLQNRVVSTYLEKIGTGGAPAVVKALKPIVHRATDELKALVPSLSEGSPPLSLFFEALGGSSPTAYVAEVDKGMANIESAFSNLYTALSP